MTGGRHQSTALLLAMAVAGCKGGAAAGDAATPQAVVGAQTAVVTKGPFTETLGAIGTVVAVNGVTVSADLPGVVQKIVFESGDRVAAGAVSDRSPAGAVRSSNVVTAPLRRRRIRSAPAASTMLGSRKKSSPVSCSLKTFIFAPAPSSPSTV